MNYSTAVFLINPKVRAITAIYEAEAPGKEGTAPRQTFKTLDALIKKDDFILVPTETRHKMTVCKVVDVDVEPPIESGEQLRWVIARIDRAEYEQLLAMECEMISKLKAAERTHQREEIRKKMFAHMDAEQVAALQITKADPVDLTGALAEPPLRAPSPSADPGTADPQF